MMLNYRFKRCYILVVLLMTLFSIEAVANVAQDIQSQEQNKLAKLENSSHGHIGVFAINTENNRVIAYHAKNRFPLCSTNKVMGVAAILKESERHTGLLNKKINYRNSEIIAWSPATKKHINSGMTITELGKAAITLSDNTAINLLMKEIDGPKGVTDFVRSIGDDTFNLDRWEPELNTAVPGDLRDTSTPEAMANSLRKLVFGHVLALKQQELLKTWLIENTTGDARIRAGTPSGWVVGDKTGTCGHYGAMNDVGIVWPKDGSPIIVAIYFTAKKENAKPLDDVIAKATRIILSAITSVK